MYAVSSTTLVGCSVLIQAKSGTQHSSARTWTWTKHLTYPLLRGMLSTQDMRFYRLYSQSSTNPSTSSLFSTFDFFKYELGIHPTFFFRSINHQPMRVPIENYNVHSKQFLYLNCLYLAQAPGHRSLLIFDSVLRPRMPQ